MKIELSGVTILVTGASRGIGRSLAVALADAGATVAVHYNKNRKDAEHLAHSLGRGSKAFQADLSGAGEAVRLFDEVAAEMGSIDVLINNAGIATAAAVTEDDEEWTRKWEETMTVNLHAAGILCKKAIRHFMTRQAPGRIINIASRAAFRGEEADYIAYAASKGGMVSLTRSIARSFGKDKVTAFVIAPGFVRTDMARTFTEQYGEEHALSELALDRLTEPEDIAPLVTLLASGLADHATGSTFAVNAGSYFH